MPRYILDTNVFTQSSRLYYRPEVHNGFWKWIEREVESGDFRSIDRVRREIKEGDDWLVGWVDTVADLFLPDDDEDTQAAYVEVVNHVNGLDKKRVAKDAFLSKADPWLIAKALTLDGEVSVVTYEVINPGRRKVPIPEVCNHFDLRCIDPYALQSETGITFNL